jgi:hypothetical protein
MASQIMEIIIFDAQPTITNTPHSLLTNSTWNKALSTLKQQNGVRAVHWGQTIESQNTVYLLIGKHFKLQHDQNEHVSEGSLE